MRGRCGLYPFDHCALALGGGYLDRGVADELFAFLGYGVELHKFALRVKGDFAPAAALCGNCNVDDGAFADELFRLQYAVGLQLHDSAH